MQPRPVATVCLMILFAVVCPPLFSQPSADSPPLGHHLTQRYRDDLDGLLKRRYVRVLTSLNRTNFFLHDGKAFGYEYEMLKAYEKFLNRGRKPKDLPVVFEFVPCVRDELLPKLVQGYGDIAAAGLTITAARRRLADFSDPYLTGIDEVVVTHRRAKKLGRIEDLSGRRVFVRKSSSYYESLTALNKKLTAAGKAPVRIVAADENLETEDILEMVNAGVIKITVSDSNIAGIWSKIFHHLVVYNDLKLRRGGKIAFMIRKHSPRLKASLNAFLKGHRKGTLLGNIYFKRYYEKNPWIKTPLGAELDRTLLKYRKLFKKYADQYGFDWLLIAALAYQESGFDNNKQNKSGAVGIMQVLPSTARDKHIGIKNVQQLENNIHAGVKYLDFIRKRYFNDPAMRPRDRVRFALAAYNAGPANIQRARTATRKMGLNPNRWFRNVEFGALKVIGSETVRYVSNINKYYLIYRFELQILQNRQKEMQQIKKQ